jgi:hypothetical protein
MEEFFGFVILAGSFAVYGGCYWGVPWALEPLDRAGKDRQGAMQFTLADILCLFVPAQLSLGVVHWVTRNAETHAKEWEWDIAIVAVMAVVWLVVVLKLSGAGIHVAWRRCVVLMVAPPMAFVGSAILNVPFWPLKLLGWHMTFAGFALLLVAAAMLGGGIFGLRRFTEAIVGLETPPQCVGESGDTTDAQENSCGSTTGNYRQRPWKNRRD